jgi:hypothetical protein
VTSKGFVTKKRRVSFMINVNFIRRNECLKINFISQQVKFAEQDSTFNAWPHGSTEGDIDEYLGIKRFRLGKEDSNFGP